MMNILIIGNAYKNIIEAVKNSKNINRLILASKDEYEGIPNINYRTVKDLASRAAFLQIDLAINNNNELIKEDIIEIFKQNRINIISVNKKWLNLEKSPFAAKQLLIHYSINTPQIIKAPLEFPVVLKTENGGQIINSITELTEEVKKYPDKPYIEEFIFGEEASLPLLWDGENIFYFELNKPLTEVQQDRLDLLKTKLNFMFSDEKADFIGFLNVKIVWTKNDWYVKEFEAGLNGHENLNTKHEILYILNSAIYQKLNELG